MFIAASQTPVPIPNRTTTRMGCRVSLTWKSSRSASRAVRPVTTESTTPITTIGITAIRGLRKTSPRSRTISSTVAIVMVRSALA
ncbi:hypothetical protein D3C74_419880 [compost metagenome]